MGQVVTRFSPLLNTNHELADEGSYFVAKNPTFGTGLNTIATPTAYDGTKPWLLAKGPTTAGKRQRWDYLRLTCTNGGTAGAALRVVITIDPATKADPTGGTTLSPLCPNSDALTTFESKFFAGTLTAAADGGSIRQIVAPLIKNALPVAGDVYLLKFGGADQGVSTTAGIVYYGGPPIIVGVGAVAQVQLILPSQSALSSYEVELGGWER